MIFGRTYSSDTPHFGQSGSLEHRPISVLFLTLRVYAQTTMPRQKSANEEPVEAPTRIEPARVEEPTAISVHRPVGPLRSPGDATRRAM